MKALFLSDRKGFNELTIERSISMNTKKVADFANVDVKSICVKFTVNFLRRAWNTDWTPICVIDSSSIALLI